MKRTILLLAVLSATLLSSCSLTTMQHIRADDEWHGQLRELAVDVIKSEGGFFPNREIYQGLLEAVNNNDPKIKNSMFHNQPDALCQYWRFVIDGGDEEFYVEICFQNWSRDAEGRLDIGVVDMLMRRKINDESVEFSMRSIRPREVTTFFRIFDGEDAAQCTPDLKSGNTTKRITAIFAKDKKGL